MSAGLVILMAWFGFGNDASDEEVIAAADIVLDGISDADEVNKGDLRNGRNIRDQLSLEDAKDIDEERTWRLWGVLRN